MCFRNYIDRRNFYDLCFIYLRESDEFINYAKKATAKELQENYEILGYSTEKVLHDLCFTEEQLQRTLWMKNVNSSDVWKLRDYLLDKLKVEGKTAYSFSALADPSANKWFTYQKTW